MPVEQGYNQWVSHNFNEGVLNVNNYGTSLHQNMITENQFFYSTFLVIYVLIEIYFFVFLLNRNTQETICLNVVSSEHPLD